MLSFLLLEVFSSFLDGKLKNNNPCIFLMRDFQFQLWHIKSLEVNTPIITRKRWTIEKSMAFLGLMRELKMQGKLSPWNLDRNRSRESEPIYTYLEQELVEPEAGGKIQRIILIKCYWLSVGWFKNKKCCRLSNWGCKPSGSLTFMCFSFRKLNRFSQ